MKAEQEHPAQRVRHKFLAGIATLLLLCHACGSQLPVGVSQINLPSKLHFIALAWAPNGETIALTKSFFGESDSGANIYLLDVTSRALDLFMEAPLGGATVLSWSPDGKQLAYRRRGGIGVVSLDQSDPPLLVGQGTLAAWSPDSRQLAIAGGFRDNPNDPWRNEIYILNLDTGQKQVLFSKTQATAFGAQLSWSPEGTRLAFAWGEPLNLYLLDVTTGGLQQLTHRVGDNDYPTWSPDGQLLAYIEERSNNAFASTIIVTRADGSCSVRLLRTEGLPIGLAWSPDGRRLTYLRGDVYAIDIAAIQGSDFLSTGPVCSQE
jgi:Tol biopolymer transport system component